MNQPSDVPSEAGDLRARVERARTALLGGEDAMVAYLLGRTDVRWVGQEDAWGCGLATLAMISGRSYSEVKASVDSWAEHDWAVNGATHYTLDRYLTEDGWFSQRRYESWGLPMDAFAPIHYASVAQPSGRGHFVVVLENGLVLDPLRKGIYALSDWERVNQLVGLWKPEDQHERDRAQRIAWQERAVATRDALASMDCSALSASDSEPKAQDRKENL